MIRRLLLFFFIVLYVDAVAQTFGGIPSSIKWKQIESPSFKVIFPDELTTTAKRVATLGERILPATASTIGSKHRKISIVLQNQTLISNGYVGLAPWRSEFFLTPLSNSLELGSIHWGDLLTVHEVRHAQQFSNFRKGFSKWAWILAGEQGQALANSATIPDWFFEGDAVFQETLLTEQGRGRLPGFYNIYRAIDEAGLNYSYQQLRNGSYKRLLPNHYTTGYLLVSEGRKRFGAEVWKKVTEKAVCLQPILYPFQGAFRRSTGMPFKEFVHESLYQDSSVIKSDEYALSQRSDRYVSDYAFPQWAGKDSLIYWKQTGRDLPAFYWRINGLEKKIRIADIQLDPAFAYRSGKLAFTSYKPDPRWGWRDYADIILFDIKSQTQKRLTSKGKYFAPDISHDGQSIVAVYADPSGKQSLILLDAETGKTRYQFSDTNHLYSYPKFSANDQHIYSLVRLPNGKMGILQTDIQSGSSSFILDPAMQAIAFLHVYEDQLFFTSTYQHRERLFRLDTKQKDLYEVGSRFSGIKQGIPNGKDSLIYTGSSAWGIRLYRALQSSVHIDKEQWVNASVLSLAEKKPLGLDTLPSSDFSVQPYKASNKLINIHSWRPAYELPDWSLTVYGQNILNTFESEAYLLYNENEGFTKTGINAAYARWFPWINFGSSYTSGRNAQVNNNRVYWDEWNFKTGITIPLNLTKGKLIQAFRLTSNYTIQQVLFRDLPKERDIRIGFLDNQVLWSVSSQQAKQHIFPRLGLATAFNYRVSVSERVAQQFLWRVNAYLPGLLKTHHLVLSGAFQSRDTANQYQFTNSFPISRGYTSVNLPRMWKLGANYHFPIAYPDFGVGNIVYFLRLRANIFYDYSQVKSLRTGRIWNMRSTGAELFFDTRWWNQQPISFGIRYSRLLSSGPYNRQPNMNQFELVLPVLF